MIHLQRIGMVNWHLMPAQDVEVRGDVGVIGENRSGKSTLLDLIQVVITGNNGNRLRLNASANASPSPPTVACRTISAGRATSWTR
ncbi:MAG: hypothetical protein EPN26_03805 [Rhodospirillales bacterium]|nr:MAG: hypothetical protein EPN26_03805 [Rhodospirillales bacterium]